MCISKIITCLFSLILSTNTIAQLRSSNENFKVKLGGFIQFDHAYIKQNSDLKASSFGHLPNSGGSELRRAAIHMSGTVYDNIDFKMFSIFFPDKTKLIEAHITLKKLPIIGNFRVGRIREPMRIDALTTSKNTTFLERSMPTGFFPIFNNGILIFNTFFNKRINIQTSYFKNTNNGINQTSITSRITGFLLTDFKENNLLHLGVSHRNQSNSNEKYAVSIRPEAHLSPQKYVNTGDIKNVKKTDFYNFEIVYIHKNFCFQSEYLLANLNRRLQENVQLSSYYGQISYILTGENKSHNRSMYFYNSVRPNKPFSLEKKQYGAWELAFRYTHTNLNNKDIFGGNETNYTTGLNWYLNPVTKIMFNHVLADIENKGLASIFQMRFQVAF